MIVDRVLLTINICPTTTTQSGGTTSMPTIAMSVFLLFLYLNQSQALAYKNKNEFILRLQDAYSHKQLFINTEGTCASNAYLFLGAQTAEQHATGQQHLGRRDARINNQVFTQWLVYNYREIPAIATFAETHKTAAEYAYYASTLAMYFIEHLETVLDSIGHREPFFTYMGFSSRMEPMMSHAVIIWYNPVDKHIFLINPQDFMEEGRIVYGTGSNWRNYFGKNIRHYSLQKYVEDNMDFFAGLGKISILTEFHTDKDPFQKPLSSDNQKMLGGNLPTTLLLPDGKQYAAILLENGIKYASFSLPNNIILSAMEDNTGNLSLMLQLPTGKTYNAIMFANGTIAPVLKVGSRTMPCIVNDDMSLTPATVLPNLSLFAATKINNMYILPIVQNSGELVYRFKNRLHTDITIKVVLPTMLNLKYITLKEGLTQHSNNVSIYNIYSIHNFIGNYTQYFALLSSVKYIFIHTETHTSYFTWLTPGSFEENKEAINSALDIVLNIKHIPGFQTISFIQPHEHRDLSQAHNKITQLNNILRIVCDGQIELGYLHEMNADELYTFSDLDEIIFRNNILLCFNIGNACVSSITMLEKPFKNRIEMESFTHPHCQGQQFNKLLRAVSIMLLPMIYPNATVYRSVAVNYLSAYQMIKYFGGMVAYDDDDINFELADYLGDIPLSQATLSQVKMFFDTVTNADVTVDMQINSKNVGNAEDVFDSVVANVDKLMCSL